MKKLHECKPFFFNYNVSDVFLDIFVVWFRVASTFIVQATICIWSDINILKRFQGELFVTMFVNLEFFVIKSNSAISLYNLGLLVLAADFVLEAVSKRVIL